MRYRHAGHATASPIYVCASQSAERANLAVKFQEIERAQYRRGVNAPGTHQFEIGEPVVAGDNCLAINETRPRRKVSYRQGNEGKPIAEIMTFAGNEAHADAVPPRHNAEAVVFDFKNPVFTDWRFLRQGRQTRLYNTGLRPATLTHNTMSNR
jgi:hypothetical protein